MKVSSIALLAAAAVANAHFTTIYTHPPNVTTTIEPIKPDVTTKVYVPGQPNPTEPGHTYEPHPTNPQDCITKTATYVYPHPTAPGESVTKTITYTVPYEGSHNTTAHYQPSHTTFHPSPSGAPHVYGNGTSTGHGGNGDNHQGGDNRDEGHQGGTQEEGDHHGNSGTESVNEPDTVSEKHEVSGPTVVPSVVPTAGAATNSITGLLAIAGVAAAYLI